jgi:SAM-dependent methyltransferase
VNTQRDAPPAVDRPAFRVQDSDPAYQADVAAEAAFWANPQFFTADTLLWSKPGPISRHNNRRLTGDASKRWFETISQHGPFHRGLVLGSGGMRQEEAILRANPNAHLTFCDVDAEGLAQRQQRFGTLFPGRTETSCIDLNFAEFEPGAYDLIVSDATLHHIINLEYLAWQINRALAPGGTFFLFDYVGANGFRYPTEQLRVFEVIYERERARRPHANLPDLRWKNVDNTDFSPFEAIRATDTLAILNDALDPVRVRTSGTVVALFLVCGITPDRPFIDLHPRGLRARARAAYHRLRTGIGRPALEPLAWERMLSPRAIAEFVFADELLSEAGWAHPGVAFGIYGKRR